MQERSSTTENYVEYINKLPGVINANIVSDGDSITEIHVLADFSRSPKQIVRDVQSLLMAKFQKEIDHKIVSVAQIDFDVNNQTANRLVIEEVSINRKRTGTSIEIVLSQDGIMYSGVQASSNDSVEILRAIAQATLDAVSASKESILKLSVLDVRPVEIANVRAALVCVSCKAECGTTGRFTGSAFVTEDDETAVVRATLNAINRRIEIY